MLFNSVTFPVFLLIVLSLYYCLARRWQNLLLLFVDDHHLSGIGAQFYSRYLAGEILNHSCLSASAAEGTSPSKN
ncbi:MAG: hypothetical protein IJH68_11030 [Thermoguttaceae bacterium]|nr:hypothetical protein [Thermoguttaceae bacterium]MBQ6620662.1 hypothetical protein [Thermoguttaceae bacterium]